jgi:hypothetical protein
MIKYDLRQQEYFMKDKEPNKKMITFMWVFFTIFIIAGTFAAVIAIVGKIPDDSVDPLQNFFDNLGAFSYIIIMVTPLVIYMVMKFIITLLCCRSSAKSSIHLKLLEGTAMPVCFCREAFRVWQTLLIYCVPIVLMYSLIFWLCVISGAGSIYIIILFFMGFYMAYDLTLVLHVLFYKIKDKMDYVSVDHHVYYLTLYKKLQI